jgi:pimeloyl-ACP methyl ester carboxylesterase
MATFVLVHGAWQGASTWDLVVPRLWAAGHRVYTPTLIGLGANAHRLTPLVNLDMHIQDVVGVINYERLQDVILVGHSYAGMIITGVAEFAKERLERLVYVDAFVPGDGQSAMQLFPERFQTAFHDQARTEGDGWRLLGSEKRLDLWGLKEGPARDFVRSKLCDFSINCFEQPLMLPTNAAATLDRTYIACVGDGYPARPVFAQFAERAQAEGWRTYELPTGHDCHVEMPEAFCELLLGLVGNESRYHSGG